jgi:HPt (histidine-containing phosphotransfer) domain-containing protein
MKEKLEKWATVPESPPPATDLQLLIDSGIEEMIPNLISIFLESAAQDIEKMRIAIHAQDAAALASAAHSLKGSCSNMGASPLYALCQQIENDGQSASLDGTAKLLESLELEFDRVREELLAVLEERPLS